MDNSYIWRFHLLLAAGLLSALLAPLLVCTQTFGAGASHKLPETSLIQAYERNELRYNREMDFFSGRRAELFRMAATLRSAGDHAAANEYLRIGATDFKMPLAAFLLAIVNCEGYGLRPNPSHAAFWAQRACELAQDRDEQVKRDAQQLLKRLKGDANAK